MDVTQTVSLSKSYAPVESKPVEQSESKLSGKSVESSDKGIGRSFHVKTGWDRFRSRVGQTFKRIGDFFCKKDTEASSRATRFNARHEKFSGKVENLVARLVKGDLSDVQDPDVLATLRNDVKHMHSDAPWAGRRDLLSTRLDVELSKLSDKEIDTIADKLKTADLTRLTDKDKTDFTTLVRAVARQQVARGTEMTTLLGKIDHEHPSKLDTASELLDQLPVVEKKLSDVLDGFSDSLPGLDKGKLKEGLSDVMLGETMSIRLKSGDPSSDKLPGMNRNLLNIGLAVRKQAVKEGTTKGLGYSDMQKLNPQLRLLSRAVREEFLKSKITDFTDSSLKSRLKVLGSGAAHEVTKGTYESGSRVHKYDDETTLFQREDGEHRFTAPSHLGLDQSDPRLLERSVVTSKYDEKLGFDVCVKTDFALHHGKLGIVMELAPGRTANSVMGLDGDPAIAQRELTKLQLLDSLTGQGDRHRGNYMVEYDKNRNITGIKGIDSDFAMGPEPGDPKDVVGKGGIHLTHLPPIVDSDMAKAIRAMTDEDIEEMCGDMFDDDTIKAAKGRLAAVKAHIDELEKNGKIISPDDWGKKDVTETLEKTLVEVKKKETVEKNGKISTLMSFVSERTSYWQRDHKVLEGYHNFSI